MGLRGVNELIEIKLALYVIIIFIIHKGPFSWVMYLIPHSEGRGSLLKQACVGMAVWGLAVSSALP